MNYALDCVGNRVYMGDWVQCQVSHYLSIKFHERRRVKGLFGDRITLRNETSPIKTSDYSAANFRLVERYYLKEQPMAANMIHVAYRLPAEVTGVEDMAQEIPKGRISAIADVSFDRLKERLKEVIRSAPESRWVILSGNTLAQMDSPPVTFRTW